MSEEEKETKKYSKELLNSKDLALTYWHTMNYFVGLIKSSEIKAGLILSLYGVLLNFVYQNVEQVKSSILDFWWFKTLGFIWIGLTLISVFYSVRSFVPRILKEYEPNMFFFGDIISKFGDIKEYSKAFLETNLEKEKLFDQLGQQIYINARITTAKFKNVNRSIRYLIYNLIILFILMFSHALVKVLSA